MEPTQPVNPAIPLDASVVKAVGTFIKAMGFSVEFSLTPNWAAAPLPQAERFTWLRVAGEPDSQRGRINFFNLCQTLENTPREIWYGPLTNQVTTARADAGLYPLTDWPEILGIYARIMAAFRLMVA